MHIALGVRTNAFPIDRFLNAVGRKTVIINAASDSGSKKVAPLTFSSNPARRGGEWLIRDQFSHRHPAWSSTAGFRATYDGKNAPYILIFRQGTKFHARIAYLNQLTQLGASVVPKELLSRPKGISTAPAALLSAFKIPAQTMVETFEELDGKEHDEPFNPANISDGRQRVLTEIVRRLGQQAFRNKLLSAYGNQCAVTRCRTAWVLEAAHITPYRGIKTNAVSNGLLLRADIHTLFDLALVSIEPRQIKIRVSSLLAGSHYVELDGRKPAFPSSLTVQPSRAALEEHYSLFQP